jgi:hypothetical protein
MIPTIMYNAFIYCLVSLWKTHTRPHVKRKKEPMINKKMKSDILYIIATPIQLKCQEKVKNFGDIFCISKFTWKILAIV